MSREIVRIRLNLNFLLLVNENESNFSAINNELKCNQDENKIAAGDYE